jgi:hypothetical protein
MKQPLEFDMRSFIHALPGLWRTERRGPALPWLVMGFCTLALLISCGGGGGVGSGGTGATATASGTVTGFGSIFVDGVRFDDSKASKRAARTAAEDGSGGVNAEIKLGQQVEFTFNGSVQDKGVASAITVAPRLIGVVTDTIPAVPNPPTQPLTAITVMGVQVAINTNAANGPVTQIDASNLSTGSNVEVHAIVGANGSLTATRIEDTAQLTNLLRGPVSNVSGTTVSIDGVTVQLSGLTASDQVKVKAATSAVVFGQYVSGVFTATATRVVNQPATSKDDGYLSGYVTGLDEVNKLFKLDGVSVSYSGASGTTGIAQGQYVRVRGVYSPTVVNQFLASKVQQRSSESSSNGGDSEIDGTVTASNPITATNTTGDITVRGIKITYTAASTTGCGVPAAFTIGTTYVSVHGNTSSTGVAATSIKCESEPSTGGTGAVVTVERVGSITEIVTAGADSGSFKMSSAKGPITVNFNSLTVFPRSPILSGSNLLVAVPVEVEGYFESAAADAAFIATKIKKQS